MSRPEENGESPAQSFEFILFKVGGFLFGAPAEQILRIHNGDKITPEEPGHTPIDMGKVFHVPEETAIARSCLLEVNTAIGAQFFEVDRVEGLTRVNLSQMRELPPLIGSQKANASFWGLALIGERIACLVDFETLRMNKEQSV